MLYERKQYLIWFQKSSNSVDLLLRKHTHIHLLFLSLSLSLYIYIYIYIYKVCVCACAWRFTLFSSLSLIYIILQGRQLLNANYGYLFLQILHGLQSYNHIPPVMLFWFKLCVVLYILNTLHIILHLVCHRPAKWFSDNQHCYIYIVCVFKEKNIWRIFLSIYDYMQRLTFFFFLKLPSCNVFLKLSSVWCYNCHPKIIFKWKNETKNSSDSIIINCVLFWNVVM